MSLNKRNGPPGLIQLSNFMTKKPGSYSHVRMKTVV